MRVLHASLAISAAVHGGVVAYVQTRPPRPEPTRVVTVQPIEIVPAPPPDPVPTEVMLLDDDSVAQAARVASSSQHGLTQKRGKKNAHEITTGATTTIETPNIETTPTTKRNTLMTMRHPKLENGPSADFWARFEANTKPLQPKEIAGEQRAREIETAEGNLGNPRWIANATPEQVAAERMALAQKRYEHSTAELRPDGAGTKSEHKTFSVKFNPDGTVDKLRDKANIQRKGLGATFDVTDGAMRAAGIDPYSSYKLKVLDETRDERAAIGKRHRTQQLAQSRQHVQKHLDRLWTITTSVADRKQGLFELWDDCAERGSEELIAGGRAAREQVVGFIRSKFPKGSTHEFTVAELSHFNKHRKSTATFDPYRE